MNVLVLLAAAAVVPVNTQAPGDVPPTAEEVVALMELPPGFEATVYASEPDVRQPVSMCLDDSGRVWVAECYSYGSYARDGQDRIVVFEDNDNDGRHDKRTVFWGGGKQVTSAVVGYRGVWVLDLPGLYFIPDADGDLVPDGPPELKLDGFTLEARHNMANGLQWGPDGWLYGRHGILAESTVRGKTLGPGLWRYHPRKDKFEVVLHGMTNPWGSAWDKEGNHFLSGNVNGHLWHAIPGALYERMYGVGRHPYAFERLTMIGDKPHYDADPGAWKSVWNKKNIGRETVSDLGGGHSHCGLMIYEGDNFPEEYHGDFYMCNTHGRRVNRDRIRREGVSFKSSYVGDLLKVNTPWFRGVSIMYGPDGGVYLSDWCDLGECHDHDGVHRTSGRIYKITYGKPERPAQVEDLKKRTDEELVALLGHENRWFEETAIRIMQERGMRDIEIHGGGILGSLRQLKEHASGNFRSQLKRELTKINAENDRVLRTVLWHYVMQELDARCDDAITYFAVCSDPVIQSYIARRAADDSGAASKMLAALPDMNAGQKKRIVDGFSEALRGRKEVEAPKGWEVLKGVPGANFLRLLYGDEALGDKLAANLRNPLIPVGFRLKNLTALVDAGVPGLRGTFEKALQVKGLRMVALRGLQSSGGENLPDLLLSNYLGLDTAERGAVLDTLAMRPEWAERLVAAVKEGVVPKTDMSPVLAKRLGIAPQGNRKAEMRDWRKKLSSGELGEPDLAAGRAVFKNVCAGCHQMYGEGGKIGPDLTGSGRHDVDYILENVFDPSASVPGAYQMSVVSLKDGRVLMGTIPSETPLMVEVQMGSGITRVDRKEIVKIKKQGGSPMPEGLFRGLTDSQVRDLVGYLQSK